MSKSNFWIFNILILIGLFFLFFAIGSLIPPFFAIFGILFLATGIYIGFKPTGTLRKKEILDSREISIEDDPDKSNEAFENPDNPIRQSKALAIKMKIKKEDKNPEVIVVPNESVESKKETENQGESEEEEEIEIEEERNESFGGKINKMPGRENKTPRKDLAFIVVGILFLLISSLGSVRK